MDPGVMMSIWWKLRDSKKQRQVKRGRLRKQWGGMMWMTGCVLPAMRWVLRNAALCLSLTFSYLLLRLESCEAAESSHFFGDPHHL